MLRAVWSAKWYILLGLLAFTLLVVATTPIHFLWKYAEPYARDLPVRIQNPTGTLWQGRADVGVPQAGTIAADWELSPLSLLLPDMSLISRFSFPLGPPLNHRDFLNSLSSSLM